MAQKIKSHHAALAVVPADHFAVGIKGSSAWWLVKTSSKKAARKHIEQINCLPLGSNLLRFYRKLPATGNKGVIEL